MIHDPGDYSSQLQRKLLELIEMVEANIVEAASRQKESYKCREPAKLNVGQQVLLDNPTRGKLHPCWTGPWEVEEIRNSSTVKIKRGNNTRMVHINRTRPLLQGEIDEAPKGEAWNPPHFNYFENSSSSHSDTQELANSNDASRGPNVVTRSGRIVRPPDYYGHSCS